MRFEYNYTHSCKWINVFRNPNLQLFTLNIVFTWILKIVLCTVIRLLAIKWQKVRIEYFNCLIVFGCMQFLFWHILFNDGNWLILRKVVWILFPYLLKYLVHLFAYQIFKINQYHNISIYIYLHSNKNRLSLNNSTKHFL